MNFGRINRSALAEVIVHKKFLIVSCILLGISGIAHGDTSLSTYRGYIHLNEISVFFWIVAMIELFVLCSSVFKDMHDVPTADVAMSLPLSAKERYFSRLLTICYLWILPFIAFFSVGSIINMITNTIGNYTQTGTHPPMLSDVFVMNVKLLFYELSGGMFIIAVTVLSVCCTGSKAESKYIPGLLMLVISILPVLMTELIQEKFVSVSDNGFSDETVSKLWGFGTLFTEVDESGEMVFIASSIIISLIVIALSVFAYVGRDATTVGNPVVYRWFFEIVMILSLALCFGIAHSSYGVDFGVMLVSFAGSIILRVVVSRKDSGIKHVVRWIILYVIYYAVFILVMYIACITCGFGASARNIDISKDSGNEKASFVMIEYTVDGPEYTSYYNGYLHYDRERIGDDKIIIPVNDPSMQSRLDRISGLVAEYNLSQNLNSGFFPKTMFGVRNDLFNDMCYVNINVQCRGKYNPDYNSYDYISSPYRASVYISQADAEKLLTELENMSDSQYVQ